MFREISTTTYRPSCSDEEMVSFESSSFSESYSDIHLLRADLKETISDEMFIAHQVLFVRSDQGG
jgi:hypothetical protein